MNSDEKFMVRYIIGRYGWLLSRDECTIKVVKVVQL